MKLEKLKGNYLFYGVVCILVGFLLSLPVFFSAVRSSPEVYTELYILSRNVEENISEDELINYYSVNGYKSELTNNGNTLIIDDKLTYEKDFGYKGEKNEIYWEEWTLVKTSSATDFNDVDEILKDSNNNLLITTSYKIGDRDIEIVHQNSYLKSFIEKTSVNTTLNFFLIVVSAFFLIFGLAFIILKKKYWYNILQI